MLSRNLKRALLDTRWPIPPAFLLPWTASLTTITHAADSSNVPPPITKIPSGKPLPSGPPMRMTPKALQILDGGGASPSASDSPRSSPKTIPIDLSPSVREFLPLLKSQGPHYITVHIHGKPYLITQGDTVRLPFLMHGVEPGDVLRLNRAINIGSRDYTLKAAAPGPKIRSPTIHTEDITGGAMNGVTSSPPIRMSIPSAEQNAVYAPHFIPHIEKGKHGYLDDRLFVCRAVIMGVESEPMRIKEKTKQRQRKVKRVKSKHRFTILKIKEVKINGVEDLEDAEWEDIE